MRKKSLENFTKSVYLRNDCERLMNEMMTNLNLDCILCPAGGLPPYWESEV